MNASSQSFAQIYRNDQKFLTNYLKRRGLTREDSEDIAQEAFLRCYNVILNEPDAEHSRLLATVAKNLHIDQYRRQSRRKLQLIDDEHDQLVADENKEKELLQKVMIDKLLASIVPKNENKFFRMHYQDGLKLQEIAERCDTALGTVASQVFRYRQKFQVQVNKAFEAEAVF